MEYSVTVLCPRQRIAYAFHREAESARCGCELCGPRFSEGMSNGAAVPLEELQEILCVG